MKDIYSQTLCPLWLTLFQVQNRPIMLPCRLLQSKIRTNCNRMPDYRKHRQIGNAVRVSIAFRQIYIFPLGVLAYPFRLCCGRHYRWQNTSRGVTVYKLKPVCNVIVNAEMIHHFLDRKVQGSGQNNLSLADLFTLCDQFLRSREYRRFQNFLEKLI